MKIIITGGSGFIGTNLSEFLRNTHEVSILDKRQPILNGIEFFNGDVTNFQELVNILKGFDIIIHLAALVGVESSDSEPIKTLDFNIGGTRNVLEACRINNIKRIIFASSSEVYGEPLKLPIEEIDNPIPITTYGLSKLTAEEYIRSYAKIYGIKYVILRLFNVYGAGQSTKFVMSEFINSALKDKEIIIHSDGSQIRSFCNVKDVVNAFSLALHKGDNETINIGNASEPISIRELARKILSMTNSNSKLSFQSFEESKRNRKEILKRIPNIDKARRLLGFNPSISLDEGIGILIESLRKIK